HTLHLVQPSLTSHLFTLSLHDALPISGEYGKRTCTARSCPRPCPSGRCSPRNPRPSSCPEGLGRSTPRGRPTSTWNCSRPGSRRSEEHTSELQSRFDLVCRLLLDKKKQ